MNAIYQFFGSIIRFFYDLTGDYTVALFFFTLIFQIILLPLGIKQQKNQVKQASLAPKLAAIRKKYAGRNDQATQQKIQQETLDLYQKENFNPAGGCLPLLVQFPVILLLYNVVRAPLSYILKYSSESIEYIRNIVEASGHVVNVASPELDLAHWMTVIGPDKFSSLNLGIMPDFKLFGIDLTQTPFVNGALTNWKLIFIPIVTFVAMYGSMFITRHFTYQSPEVKEQQKSCSMRIMNLSMPLMSVYFAAIWPATLGVYWIIRNILQTIQQIVLAKLIPVPVFSDEDFKKAEREYAGKKSKKDKKEEKAVDPNRPKVRSLHYIDEDDEDYPVLPDKVEKKVEENVPAADSTKDTENKTDAENNDGAPADHSNSVVAPAPLKDENDKNNK